MFGADFFREELPGLRTTFEGEQGGQTATIELLLAHGITFRTEQAPEARVDYLVVTYTLQNEARRALVPYGSIVAVNLLRSEAKKHRTAGIVV